MKKEKIYLHDTPGVAEYRTDIKGWVGRNGQYYGDMAGSERWAREANATHKKCKDCGAIYEKTVYERCDECNEKEQHRRYLKEPFKEYNGEPVVIWNGDRYFFNEDDLICYMQDHGLNEVDLRFAVSNEYDELTSDYWDNILLDPLEYGEYDGLEKLIAEFNEKLKKLDSPSWTAGIVRTTYKLVD